MDTPFPTPLTVYIQPSEPMGMRECRNSRIVFGSVIFAVTFLLLYTLITRLWSSTKRDTRSCLLTAGYIIVGLQLILWFVELRWNLHLPQLAIFLLPFPLQCI